MPEGLPLSHRTRRDRLVLALIINESGAYGRALANIVDAQAKLPMA